MTDKTEIIEQDDKDDFDAEFERLRLEEQGGAAEEAHQDPLDEPALEDEGDKSEDTGQEDGTADTPPAADAAAPPPAAKDETDIWADAPEHLREAFRAEREQRERTEQTLRSQNGRLSSATRELNALKASLSGSRDEAAAADEGDQAKSKKERLAQLREEYPEVAEPILDHMAGLERRVDLLSASEGTRAEDAERERIITQERLLAEAHPDWVEIRSKDLPKFKEWMDQQPEFMRAVIEKNGNFIDDASEVSTVLNAFKRDTGYGAQAGEARRLHEEKRKSQLEGLSAPRGSKPAAAARAPNDFDAAWDHFSALDRQRAKR